MRRAGIREKMGTSANGNMLNVWMIGEVQMEPGRSGETHLDLLGGKLSAQRLHMPLHPALRRPHNREHANCLTVGSH